jgi:O-antigen/teichoic acid export membrane protein
MSEQASSYKSIFKATSLFGGVQIMQILVGLIKGKLIATLLGPSGIGITALFTSPLNMITTVSSFGLNSSAIKDISQASKSIDKYDFYKIVHIYKKLLFVSCLVGVCILLIGSSFFSQYSFGNNTYTISFMLLTLMIIPTLLSQGYITILQGNRSLAFTAKLSIWSSLFGIFSALPFYYFLGINGIIPALIIPQWLTFFLSVYYVNKLKIQKVLVSKSELLYTGKKMVKLGFALMVSILIGQLTIYILNLFISSKGSLTDVGYMNAAIGMTTTVISMVFSAMGSDYFPRLAAVCNEPIRMNETVNRQGEILLLIILPILLSFSLFSEIIIYFLLSSDFLVITKLIRILSFGMFIKAASYSLGYISFAKGDKKTFFLFEAIWSNSLNLVLNILGYKYLGLDGLGYSFILSSLLYIFSVAIIANLKYGYKPTIEFRKIIIIVFILSFLMLLNALVSNSILFYFIGSILMMFSIYYSYKELDLRLGIKSVLINLKNILNKNNFKYEN